MSDAQTPAKICIRCGEDCANRPRSKDKQGRYTCDDCAARLKSARGAGAPAPTSPAPPPDDGIIALLDDAAPAAQSTIIPCPNCARPIASDAVICMGCGFNRQTGRNVTTALESGGASGPGLKRNDKKKRVCRKCGYELAGLKSYKCPECGTVNPPETRRDRDREDSRRVARNAWISPIIMFVIGTAISSAIIAGYAGPVAVVGHLIYFAISLFVGLVVYVMCSFMWIGFDEPLPMTALRLAGVYALADIGYTLVGMVGALSLGFLTWGMYLAPMIIYILLLAHIMELDYEDAVIVAVVTTVAKIMLSLFVWAMIAGWL